MPRIRSLKPEAFESETLAEVSVYAERTFHGMSTQADDRGRLEDKPAALNGRLWAVRNENEPHTAKDLESELQQLERVGLICRYVGCDGKRYLHLVTWDEDQKIDKPSKPRTPRCPVHQADDVCGKHATDPCPAPPMPGKPDDSREDSANPRESSRALDSRETGTNRTTDAAESQQQPADHADDTTDDRPADAEIVILADRLRDQQEHASQPESPETVASPRESSMLDLGPRTVDLGSVPPTAGPDEPGTELALIPEQPPASKKPRKSRKKADRTPLDDLADELTNFYWDHHKATTAHKWIAIRQIVLTALQNGVGHKALEAALDMIGCDGKPITSNTLTYALGEVAKARQQQPTGNGVSGARTRPPTAEEIEAMDLRGVV